MLCTVLVESGMLCGVVLVESGMLCGVQCGVQCWLRVACYMVYSVG